MVENVFYLGDTDKCCYIAIKVDFGADERSHKYHRSKRCEPCTFALAARLAKKRVILDTKRTTSYDSRWDEEGSEDEEIEDEEEEHV